MMSALRPYQQAGIDRLRESLRAGHKRVVVQGPCGFGKTLVAAAIIEMAREKGNRVIFTVPALSLVDQTVQSFYREGIVEVGVLQANHHMTDPSKPVQVASVQTLARRKTPDAQLVIIDECHMQFKAVHDWMNDPDWAQVPFIGLSATPWAKGMGKNYTDLVIAATTADLIEQKYLSPFRVFASGHPDLTGVRTTYKSGQADYRESDLAERMNTATIVADVVSTWLRHGEDRPTLCFGVNCAHAKHLQKQFEDAGVSCAYQDAYTDAHDRMCIANAFREGRTKVVCNVGTLTTGVDWDVRCIILARPTKSEILHVQIIGRGLRTADGKDDCLILDHADNNLRLGFVTDIHHTELDDGNGKPSLKAMKPLPKECPKCAFLKPPRTRECPNCGHITQAPPDTVEVEDGELVEITPGKKPKRMTSEDKRRAFGGLKRIASERGYKIGWANHKFRELTGVWPNAYRWEPECEPEPWLKRWVKSRMIAWVKAKEKREAESGGETPPEPARDTPKAQGAENARPHTAALEPLFANTVDEWLCQ